MSAAKPDITLKLSQLQNLCKRDPQGHRVDYDAQIRRLQSECHILSLNPSAKPPSQLSELIQFAAAVSSSSYDQKTSDAVANLLVCLLLGKSHEDAGQDVDSHFKSLDGLSLPASALTLHKDVRKSCVSSLILMRNKGKLPPLRLLELFYRVMAVIPDKGLREQLYRHIVNDVRNINKKGKRDEKVNRNVQAFLHKVVWSTVRTKQNKDIELDDNTKFATKRAVDMITELYRRKVWTDERTVSIMASAVESVAHNVAAAAMRFFLNIENKMADDKDREENDEWEGVQEVNYHAHSRTTKARTRQIAKQVKNKIKAQKKKELELDTTDPGVEACKNLYPAIELLRDPHGLAEAVLKRVQTTGANGFRFEHKLLAMNFATRLVGNHELILLNLYPFLRRYMGGHQRDVTAVLTYAVQACHEMVPPEEVHGLLQTIAHNFVTERCSGEQIAVGINACRAICARVPSSLVKEDSNSSNDEKNGSTSSVHVDVEAFARDLAGYAKHKDRSVAVAGRSWQNFVRSVYPALLQGKDRGTVGSALHRNGEKPLRYGERRIAAGVKGADLLVEYESKKEAFMKKKAEMRARGEDDDGIGYEPMNDEDEWVEVEGEDEEDGWEEVEGEDEEDEVAPNLVEVKKVNGKVVPVGEEEEKDEDSTIDLSKMSTKERQKLAMDVSSTRVFTTADFEKMRRLVERENRAKRDPRAAAKMKRLRAKGEEFEELSDDSDPDSDDEGRIHTKGAVNVMDLAAEAKRKRANKIERLEKILSGREKFEHNQREGGSTNTEKTRKKSFLMTKFSFANREKQGSKETARRGTLKKEKKLKFPDKQGNKKRRRKM